MTAYCTLDDLVSRFGLDEIVSAADRDGDGVPDEDVVAAAIADASAEIDVRLARRYRVPFTRATELLRRWSTNIARYFLFESRPHEEARRRYEDVIATLDMIASGELQLGSEETDAQPDGVGKSTVSISAPESAFDEREQIEFMGRLR